MSPRQILLLALCGVVFGAGCRAHVQLPEVPARDAPVEQREAAYRQLAPQAVTERVHFNFNGTFGSAYQTTEFLMLRNGLRVYHPEDLLPAVDPSSPTAGYIDAYLTAQRRTKTAAILSSGAAGLAGVALLASLPFKSQEWQAQSAYVAAGTAGVAFLVGIVFSYIYQFQREDEKASAFLSYDGSLQERLGVTAAPSQP